MFFRPTHAAAGAALLALAATAACSPTCVDVPATGGQPVADNPFGMDAPRIGAQGDAYDSGFTVEQGGRVFQIATTEIGLGETYDIARNRAFFAAQQGNVVTIPAGAGPFIGVPDQPFNPLGGNAVAYGIDFGDAIVPFADLAGLEARGIDWRQADYIESAAYEHVDILNSGIDGFLPAYFQTYRTRADRAADPEGAAALLAEAVKQTNDNLRDRFQGTPGLPGVRCPADRAWSSDGDDADPVMAERAPREPGNPFPWDKVLGVLAALTVVGLLAKATRDAWVAGAARYGHGNKFDVLYADSAREQEVIVLRNTAANDEQPDAIWVFERKSTNDPAKTSVVSDGEAYVGKPKKRGKYTVTKSHTAWQRTETTAAVKNEMDDFIVTTGPVSLWNDRIKSIVDAGATEGGLTQDEVRTSIRNITAGKTKTKTAFKKRGRILGWFPLPKIVRKNSVALALDNTVEAIGTDRDEARVLVEIARTLQARKSQPYVSPTI